MVKLVRSTVFFFSTDLFAPKPGWEVFLCNIYIYILLICLYTVEAGCKSGCEMVQKVLLGMKISLFHQEKSTGGPAGAGGKSCDELSMQKPGQESFWATGLWRQGWWLQRWDLGSAEHHVSITCLLCCYCLHVFWEICHSPRSLQKVQWLVILCPGCQGKEAEGRLFYPKQCPQQSSCANL